MSNGVSGKDLLEFSDEDFRGDDLGLSFIQVTPYCPQGWDFP